MSDAGDAFDRATREHQLRELAHAMQEAAAMPAPTGSLPLDRVGDVVEALADTAGEMRRAYWGHPHPGSVGDNPLLVLVDGREHAVTAVRFEMGRMIVEAEPRQ